MPSAKIFNIEHGVLAFTLVGDDDPAEWQAPGGKEASDVVADDYEGGSEPGGTYSCQVQSGQLTASANTSDKTTAPTFCDPEVVTTQVGVTSFQLEATILQDPHDLAGISRYLFQWDTRLAYFALGLNSWGAPKAVGRCRIVAGAFGGEARADLTSDLQLPVEVKPDIQWGTDAAWEITKGDGTIVTGGGSPATGATAGIPGSWTPAGSVPPANVTDLAAGTPNAVTASPATAWTTGQYVQTAEVGTPGQAYWDGSAWVAGTAAVLAGAGASTSSSSGE